MYIYIYIYIYIYQPSSHSTNTQAELGEIGMREFGECLLAVERVVTSTNSRQRGDQGDGKLTGADISSGRLGVVGGQNSVTGTARHRKAHRLLVLATPAGAAAGAVGARLIRRVSARDKVQEFPLHEEARVVKCPNRGGSGRVKGYGGASSTSEGNVVAVVKRPLKRWNTMVGTYTSVHEAGQR